MSIGVGATTKVSGGGATSKTTAGVTTTSGSTVVIGVSWTSTMTFTSLVDSNGNTWNQIGTEQSVGAEMKSRLYRAENIIGGSGHTFTATISAAELITLSVLEITGAAASSFDQHAETNDFASPFTSGATPTTTQANEMLVGFLAGDSASNPATHGISGATPSSGWTIQSGTEELDGSVQWTAAMATNIVSATGVYTAGFTESGGGSVCVFIATFKEASPGPTQTRDFKFGPGISPDARQQFRSALRSNAIISNVTVSLSGQAATFAAGTLVVGASGTTLGLGQGPGIGPFNPTPFVQALRSNFLAPGGNVSLALIGQAGTFNAGTLAANISVALTGQGAVFAAGTLTPAMALALNGQAAAFAAGTVAPGSAVAATGQARTFAPGTLIPSSTIGATGSSATFALGTLTPNLTLGLTGLARTFAAGTLVATPTLGLSGQQASFAAGTLAPSIAVALVGQNAIFAAGTVSTGGDVVLALTGQAASFSAGVLARSTTIALAGGAASFAAGNLLPGTSRALTGTALTASAGVMAPATATALQGLSASFTAGLLGLSGDVTVALTGQRATFAAGNLAAPGHTRGEVIEINVRFDDRRIVPERGKLS